MLPHLCDQTTPALARLNFSLMNIDSRSLFLWTNLAGGFWLSNLGITIQFALLYIPASLLKWHAISLLDKTTSNTPVLQLKLTRIQAHVSLSR